MSFEIKSAKYGAGETFMDATAIVTAEIEDDALTLAVANSTFGNDPVPNVKKGLVIEYEHDGEEISKSFVEGSIVELPHPFKQIRKEGRFILNLPEVSLMTACWGSQAYLTTLIWAYKQFKDKVLFKERLFFISSSIDYEEYAKFFKKEKITVRPLPEEYDIKDYNRLIMKDIHKYIKGSHVLIFQTDGFISNIHKWTDEFLEYDYIGAPWWYKDNNNVGNGGFSLRSKKLQKILATDEKIVETYAEDHHTCRTYGDYLREEHGIKYAPESLASRFSAETGPYGDQFGFHGTWQWDEYIKRTSS